MPQDADSAIPETLLRNLRALAAHDQPLVERLLLPTSGDHVRIDPDGTGYYREHDEFVAFTVPASDVTRILGQLDQGHVLAMGVGLGELLEPLLAERPERRVVAWDRDPWLLRQTLIARDYSSAIESGQLTVKLGADLVELVESDLEFQVLPHPFLSQVYRWELHCLEHGVSRPRAALVPGTLVADDLAQALREAGYAVLPIEVQRWSEEELTYAVQRIDPRLVACVNYTVGLAEFCRTAGRPLLVWEIDPTTDNSIACSGSTDHAHVFTYRKRNVREFLRAGFEHAEYLPLASDTERRRPLTLNSEEQERFGSGVSFVGSSLVANAARHRDRLCELYADWHMDGARALPEFRASLRTMLDEHRLDGTHGSLPELMHQGFGDFLDTVDERGGVEDVASLLSETAASERRMDCMVHLAGALTERVCAWGDTHWRSLESRGVRYGGVAGHREELTRIYNASSINVDIGRLYQTDIVTMRVFDVLACGGFLITQRSEALAELFEVGVELETYSSLEELGSKVQHFLAYPDEAHAIAERGLIAVRERHDVRSRVRHMLSRMDLEHATVPA